MYTVTFNAQITEIVPNEDITRVPFKEDGISIDETALANEVKLLLSVDDVVITEAKVFEGEE